MIGIIIGETQTSFIKDKQILNANEVISWLKKKRLKGALFIVEFRKSYNSVRWYFLEHMLKQVGFGPKMKKLVDVFS